MQLANSIQVASDAKRIKTCFADTSDDECCHYSLMLLKASLQQNGVRLTAAIANFVHFEGLPFLVVDKPTFHVMIEKHVMLL
jgi:hypothetical protein